jgi:hypothetical protein
MEYYIDKFTGDISVATRKEFGNYDISPNQKISNDNIAMTDDNNGTLTKSITIKVEYFDDPNNKKLVTVNAGHNIYLHNGTINILLSEEQEGLINKATLVPYAGRRHSIGGRRLKLRRKQTKRCKRSSSRCHQRKSHKRLRR